MITATRVKTISKLAIPVGVALSSNVLLSLIDLAMVGTLGNNAIAAVGLSVFSNTLVVAFVTGIMPAVQGLVARRRGEDSSEPRAVPLNGGLFVALLLGIPLTIVCCLVTPSFFSMISPDAEVIKIGVPFLRTLYLGIVATGMNKAFEGYWAGMEKPRVYMSITLITACLNVFLNYVLIFGHFGAPALGATGAAIGTVLSLYMGTLINCWITYFWQRQDGFLTAKPERSLLASMFKLGLPATFQGFFVSAGYIVFYWLIGRVGTEELAALNVLVRVSMVLTLLAMSLGNASATLVCKTVGEGDYSGAAAWGWDSGKLGVIGITLLGLPILLFPRLFLSIFLSDPHTISMAVVPLRLVAGTAGLGSLIFIFAYTLVSLGDGSRVATISFATQWLFFLPAVWLVGPHLHYGLLPIALVQTAYGTMATALITWLWADGRWKRIRV